MSQNLGVTPGEKSILNPNSKREAWTHVFEKLLSLLSECALKLKQAKGPLVSIYEL